MSEHFYFKGNVSQAVMGDVNEAPRINNVVTLNMGQNTTPERRITENQRCRIVAMIERLVAISGNSAQAIYCTFLAEFGIERLRELPRERYKEAVAQIDTWITDATYAAEPRKSVLPSVEAGDFRAVACALCQEKDISFRRLQCASRAQLLTLIVCLTGCGWLLYKMPNADGHTDDSGRCFYDGKPYSAGSTIKGTGGTLRECRVDVTGRIAWGRPV